MPWLTGDEISADRVCRAVSIPAETWMIAAVSGALLDLTRVENWEQLGDITPAEAAAAFTEMWFDFIASECAVGGAMELIGHVTNPTSTAYLEIGSIPATYRALKAVVSLRSNTNAGYDAVLMTVNGDNGNNYRYGSRRVQPSAGAVVDSVAVATSAMVLPRLATDSNSETGAYGHAEILFPNYADSSHQKAAIWQGSHIGEPSITTADVFIHAGVAWWVDTSNPIASIRLTPNNGSNWIEGCHFTLYGLKQ